MHSQEWEIKPREKACKVCQKPFSDGEIYISSLRLNVSEYERSDCCENCWKLSASGETFSVWRGTFRSLPPVPEVLKKETAESLLRKLIEKNEPGYRNAIFILAVMLERRRILAEKEVQKKDEHLTIRVYEHRRTGETFIVNDPILSLDQLEHVQEEVSALLAGSEELPVEENKSVTTQVQQNA